MNKQKVALKKADLFVDILIYIFVNEKAMYILFNYRESLRPKISI